MNKITKILCSVPVILILLYFLPPLGVLVFLARYLFYGNRHFFRAPICITLCAGIIALPYGLEQLLRLLHVEANIPYLYDILNWEHYQDLLSFARFSFIVAVIILIVTSLLRKLIDTLSSKISQFIGQYYAERQQRDDAITKENDLKLKEKALTSKQKTPHVVKCPHCGKTNSIIGTVGKCKSCRSAIEYKGKI